MLLAQHGADVIKVEPTGEGDWSRTLGTRYGGHTAYSIPTNLGKRSIALDLKSDAGKDVLWRLIDGADVLLEGFRPGVLDRLGFGYEAVAKREPRILYLSVSGFGQTGPLAGPAGDGPRAAGLHRSDDRQQGRGRHPASRAVRRHRHVDCALCLPGASPPRSTPVATSRAADTSRSACSQAASAMQVIRMMMVYLEGEQVRRAMPSGVFKTADGWLQFLIVRQQQWVSLCGVLERPRARRPIRASSTRRCACATRWS